MGQELRKEFVVFPASRETEVRKIVSQLGDEVNTEFVIKHPFGFDLVYSLHITNTGEMVQNAPTLEPGQVRFFFARPPKQNEYTAVLIG